MQLSVILAFKQLMDEETAAIRRTKRLKLAYLFRLRNSLRVRYFLHSSSLVHPSQSAWNKLYESGDDGSLLVVCRIRTMLLVDVSARRPSKSPSGVCIAVYSFGIISNSYGAGYVTHKSALKMNVYTALVLMIRPATCRAPVWTSLPSTICCVTLKMSALSLLEMGDLGGHADCPLIKNSSVSHATHPMLSE